MIIRYHPLVFSLFILIINQAIFSQEIFDSSNKKILVLGSSVAAGWVTSYQEKYDFKNGYAFRLERYLEDKGFDVIHKGIPGDNTSDAMKRFDEDVLTEKPDYVLIGLSMSNEGLETGEPDSVSLSFETGIKKLIANCEEYGIYPVIGQCYANNNFTQDHYIYLKKMNIQMNSWGYPCINFLGALEDGNGHFPEGTTFDPNHPDNHGHEEFFLAINPGLFQSIDIGKKVPELIQHTSSTTIGEGNMYESLYYFPANIIHSFSLGFEFKINGKSKLASIILSESANDLTVGEDLCLDYNGLIKSMALEPGTWHEFMIVHRYLDKKSLMFLDDQLMGEVQEQIEPACFTLGDPHAQAEFRNLMIYRAALNQDEINANNDLLIHASLACYATLEDENIENLAQNTTGLHTDPTQFKKLLAASIESIKNANDARETELDVEIKKPVEVDPSIYREYTGKYIISEDDFFLVETENDKLYFIDRGHKAEILPESDDKFFIYYPGDLTFTFERDETGKVITLIANFNGYILKGDKEN